MDRAHRRHSPSPKHANDNVVACPLLERQHEAWISCCTARFLRLARRLTGDDETAHDALQESWIAVLRGVRQYRGDSPACAWVGAIVRHEAHRQATRRCRGPTLDAAGDDRTQLALADGGESPEDHEHVRQTVRILLETVDRLPATYRQIVQLRDLQELPPDEVAERLHISRSSVSSRLHRAHGLLRRLLLRRLGGGKAAR